MIKYKRNKKILKEYQMIQLLNIKNKWYKVINLIMIFKIKLEENLISNFKN